MKNDGKGLEKFVRSNEEALALTSLKLIQNRRVVSEDGTQLAELDLEIVGTVNGQHVHTLIECRDRPSQGKAPSSWIQQMAGRRLQFGFSKVIAVSTTGFSPAATAAAKGLAVELRELTTTSSPPSREWLRTLAKDSAVNYSCKLISAQIGFPKTITGHLHSHLQRTIRSGNTNALKLVQSQCDRSAGLQDIWDSIWYHERHYFSKILEKHDFLRITIRRKFVDEYQIWLETDQVCAAIDTFSFLVELSVKRGSLSLLAVEHYSELGNQNPLSTTEVSASDLFSEDIKFLTQKVYLPGGGYKYRMGVRTPKSWRPPSSSSTDDSQ